MMRLTHVKISCLFLVRGFLSSSPSALWRHLWPLAKSSTSFQPSLLLIQTWKRDQEKVHRSTIHPSTCTSVQGFLTRRTSPSVPATTTGGWTCENLWFCLFIFLCFISWVFIVSCSGFLRVSCPSVSAPVSPSGVHDFVRYSCCCLPRVCFFSR